MSDWDRVIDQFIANRPEPQNFSSPEEYAAAMARYADVLARVARRFGIGLNTLPEGARVDSEGLIQRTRR